MRGKFFKVAFGLTILAIGINYGCGRNVEERKATLIYTVRGGVTDIELNRRQIEAFQHKYPHIKVKMIHTVGDYWAKIQTMIAGGTSPDVMMDGWLIGASYLSHEAILETFLNLQPFVEKDKEFQQRMEDFYPITIEAHKYRRDIYALPRCQNPIALFYNKKLFDELNISYPDENWTWEIFLEACKNLTRDRDGDGKIDQYGIAATTPYFWQILVWQNEGEIFNADKSKCLLDSGEAIEALQWYSDLINKYKVAPQIGQIREQSDESMFMAGKIAMYPAGYYMTTQFMNIKDFTWDVAHLPKGKRRITIDNIGNYTIYAKTKYPQETWEFIKFLTSKKVQEMAAEYGHDVPILKSVASSPIFLAPQKPPANAQVFLESLEYGRNVYDAFPPAVLNGSTAWTSFFADLGLVWIGKKSAEVVCKNNISKVNALLQKTQGSD